MADLDRKRGGQRERRQVPAKLAKVAERSVRRADGALAAGVDRAQLARGLRFINAKCDSMAAKARALVDDFLDVGRFVLKEFFGDDPRLARDKSPRTPTYDALASHPDLRMSPQNLWKATTLACLERAPGGAAIRELTP